MVYRGRGPQMVSKSRGCLSPGLGAGEVRRCTSEVTWADWRFAPDFQARVLERAYFQYVSGASEDEISNYYEALRIELTQTP